MTKTAITKLEAARALLDCSLELLLDRGDYVSAIVLAGSAEDVMQGLLVARGVVGARAQLIEPAKRLLKANDPDAAVPSDSRFHSFIREVFNWLRHNDREGEPQAITVDLQNEAIMCAMRAMDNFWSLTQSHHPREQELLRFERGHRP